MQSHIRTDYISGNHFKVAVQLQAVISSYLFVCVCISSELTLVREAPDIRWLVRALSGLGVLKLIVLVEVPHVLLRSRCLVQVAGFPCDPQLRRFVALRPPSCRQRRAQSEQNDRR